MTNSESAIVGEQCIIVIFQYHDSLAASDLMVYVELHAVIFLTTTAVGVGVPQN